jgi:ATP/maltotriose-dependent transcriptional regulator MalT
MRLTLTALAFESGDWERAGADQGPSRPTLAGVLLIFRGIRDAELALGRGDVDEAAAALSAVEPLVRVSAEAQWHGQFGSLLGELRRRQGDLGDAREAVAHALDELEVCTDDVMSISRVTAVGLSIEADQAVRARDLREPTLEREARERARIHLDRVTAAAEEGGPVERAWLAVGLAERARADGGASPALWETAAVAFDGLGRPYPAATARWRQAEAFVELADRDAAGPVAAAALTVARRLGAGWLEGEVSALIARARLELPADPLASSSSAGAGAVAETVEEAPFGLTPRELQVLALVAAGATNRQIGSSLYMAEKTASVHVSRILAKLGVQSRTQAAAVAHRMHLTASPAA